MSSAYISAELRRLVDRRAAGICEYCLIAEADTFFGCEVDHVISEKHGGETVESNLAKACVYCNQAKGSDVGSIHWATRSFIRFFNPRTDRWAEHFELHGLRIDGCTPIGDVTSQILRFNSWERMLERDALIAARRYPNAAALSRIRDLT